MKKPEGPSRLIIHTLQAKEKWEQGEQRGDYVTSFLALSFLADTNHWDSGEFTLLRGNSTRAGGGSAPSFLKAWISPIFSLLKVCGVCWKLQPNTCGRAGTVLRGDVGPRPKDSEPHSKDRQSCLPFKIESLVDLNLNIYLSFHPGFLPDGDVQAAIRLHYCVGFKFRLGN